MSCQDLINDVSEMLAEGWGTLFQKQVSLGASQWPEDQNSSADLLQGNFVSCDLAFGGDIEGRCKLFLTQTDALTMVGMMLSMGADDELVKSTRDGELGAEQLDALQEVLNQTASTMAMVLREKLSCSVQASTENIESVELAGSLAGAEGQSFSQIELTLEGFDVSTLFMCFDESLYGNLNKSGDVVEMDEGLLDALSSESNEAPEIIDEGSALDKIEKIKNIKVQTQAILAEREMEFEELLKLSVGSVLEFWKNCDDPAELCIEDTVLADGEIVTYENQQFGIRLFSMAPQKAEYKRRKK